MDVCKCENLNIFGSFDVVQRTVQFTNDNGYLKEVQFEFFPKHRTKRFLLFCGTMVPVGADDDAVRDVIVKVRQERPAADAYWGMYFSRLQLAHVISIKFSKLLEELDDEERELEFIEEYEVRFNGYSQWDGFMMQFKDYDHRTLTEGEHVVVQQYLYGKYEKFTESDTLIESLLHYSYHYSEGKYVLWGVRGVRYEDLYRLTTPFFHSVSKVFGPRDKGSVGIQKFFDRHVCTDICRKWRKPPKSRGAEIQSVKVSEVEVELSDSDETSEKNLKYSVNTELPISDQAGRVKTDLNSDPETDLKDPDETSVKELKYCVPMKTSVSDEMRVEKNSNSESMTELQDPDETSVKDFSSDARNVKYLDVNENKLTADFADDLYITQDVTH